MNEKQIKIGLMISIALFKIGFFLFLFSTYNLIMYKKYALFYEYLWQFSMFLTATSLALAISFRRDITIKQGFFGKWWEILIPWKY